MSIKPGTILSNKYQVVEQIGSGGMGAVYRAREIDFQVNRSVAIKVLPSQLAQDPKIMDRFVEEIKIATQLDHPHIVPIYYVGREKDLLYFVMKYVRGETVKARIKREGSMDPAAVAYLMQPIARALEYIHGKGAIHRDIKSVNIMIDDSGNGVLMDFGIAKMAGGADLTPSGEVLGTAPYMAPEQWNGEKNPSSDIYALGIVMYEMLTGAPPFVGESLPEIMQAHLQRPPMPITTRKPKVPAALAEVVHRCLAKAPAERYETAAHLAKALSNVQRQMPAEATTPPTLPEAGKKHDPAEAATMIPSERAIRLAMSKADQLAQEGFYREARQTLADAVGLSRPQPDVEKKLDQLAQLALADDKVRTQAEELLREKKFDRAKRLIRDHLEEHPASRLGELLVNLVDTESKMKQGLVADAPAPAEPAEKSRFLKKLLIALIALAAVFLASLVFHKQTSNLLVSAGDSLFEAKRYGSPPVLNAVTCYHLSLFYNKSNQRTRESMHFMAQGLTDLATQAKNEKDYESALRHLNWALAVETSPEREKLREKLLELQEKQP